MRTFRFTIVTAVVLAVFSGCYIEYLSEQEYEALRLRMVQACERALPETPPTPVLRACGKVTACLYCVDGRGVLHPVHLPCPEGKRYFESSRQNISCDR